jgi:hypothetical protein
MSMKMTNFEEIEEIHSIFVLNSKERQNGQ